MGKRFTYWIIGGLILGAVVGYILYNTLPDQKTAAIVEAMANNEILQIVVFAIFAGIAVTALGEKGKQIVAVADELAHVMLKITNYVMLTAPLAVFAAVAATVTTNGIGILVTYGKFMGEFYLCLVLLWVILILAG